ncbi:MAG: alpha-ketoglutarate-dependent dioxygenase AlkB [Verrucomicrobiales bacterium]|nr:alpha-ketoglutarate-dependent dioxygenase AlkB [Verrucomicrobiales bacterium]
MHRMLERHGFASHSLNDGNVLWVGALPDPLRLSATQFEALWNLKPDASQTVLMFGRPQEIPRKQQAYGADYRFSGQTSVALPVPELLLPFLTWAKETTDDRLNGLLLNWYDGALGHYIGQHRDSRSNLIKGSPIVTISHGEERSFQLKPWKRPGVTHRFASRDGTVFVMPFQTNLDWTHGVPVSRSQTGRRISVTLRAFVMKQVPDQVGIRGSSTSSGRR